MPSLTTQILQQIKEKFRLRMSWNLGVTHLVFRVEDGLYELHRRVPYDYDSEYQNMYLKTAVALIEEHITVHDALIFQQEIKDGIHTSRGGKYLRKNPSRILLYPFQAATCCVIFFQGDWIDAGVAAVCGLCAGIIDAVMSSERVFANVNDTKLMIDCVVSFSTGVIGGLFYEYAGGNGICLRAVFLGTLYWFFYGTAFVIGLLEIIAGELQTGVTRFLAVSVKTFVLAVGSSAGLGLVLKGDVFNSWTLQHNVCGTALDIDNQWWRSLFYVLCSVSVLGQYRFIVMNYWAGLLVQVAAYETQYWVLKHSTDDHQFDGMDTVYSNVMGAAAAVATASLISFVVDFVKIKNRINFMHGVTECKEPSFCGKLFQNSYRFLVGCGDFLHLGRGLNQRIAKVNKRLEKELKEGTPIEQIHLSETEEATLVEAAVEAQELNVWSLLMPAVYQLVPGSKIAGVWYEMIFPAQIFVSQNLYFTNDTEYLSLSDSSSEYDIPDEVAITADSPSYELWLTSVSLALGLLLGLMAVRIISSLIQAVLSLVLSCFQNDLEPEEVTKTDALQNRRYGRLGVTHNDADYDPDGSLIWETQFEAKYGPVNKEPSSDASVIDPDVPRDSNPIQFKSARASHLTTTSSLEAEA